MSFIRYRECMLIAAACVVRHVSVASADPADVLTQQCNMEMPTITEDDAILAAQSVIVGVISPETSLDVLEGTTLMADGSVGVEKVAVTLYKVKVTRVVAGAKTPSEIVIAVRGGQYGGVATASAFTLDAKSGRSVVLGVVKDLAPGRTTYALTFDKPFGRDAESLESITQRVQAKRKLDRRDAIPDVVYPSLP